MEWSKYNISISFFAFIELWSMAIWSYSQFYKYHNDLKQFSDACQLWFSGFPSSTTYINYCPVLSLKSSCCLTSNNLLHIFLHRKANFSWYVYFWEESVAFVAFIALLQYMKILWESPWILLKSRGTRLESYKELGRLQVDRSFRAHIAARPNELYSPWKVHCTMWWLVLVDVHLYIA